MCGIAGYFLKFGHQALPDSLAVMQASLHHRGPDGRDAAHCGRAGFTQTRLAIIDLEGGRQPFVYNRSEGQAMLVANGEIYNHESLRDDFSQSFAFQSRSDCEVLLPLWLTRPQDIVSAPRGMFAAAFYDAVADTGCLIRDPFGIKPLYYVEHETGLYFASEISALRAAGLDDSAPDRLQAAYLLDRQFAPYPISAFAGIQKLAPGEQITVHKGLIINRASVNPNDSGRQPSAATELGSRLAESVEAHQMSDVPFGLFLSGGVDSSALLASMAQLRQAGKVADHTPQLLAYTARFDCDDVADETDMARYLAQKTQAEFIDITYDQKQFFADCGAVVQAMDDPVADYAILPSFALAKRARQDVKVVLSGEGGDEFFAGYGRYRAGLRLLGAKQPNRPGLALRSGLLRPDLARRLQAELAGQADRLPSLADRFIRKDDSLKQLQRYDIESWLPDNLLVKLDRCLMRNSLEGRTPFIDKKFSGYGFALPFDQKIRGRHGKYALKSWLAEHLPESQPFRRKRGFTVPVGHWIAADADRLGTSVQKLECLSEVLIRDQIKAVFSRASGTEGALAWRILFYALWHQIHVRSVVAEQPVLDILNS